MAPGWRDELDSGAPASFTGAHA